MLKKCKVVMLPTNQKTSKIYKSPINRYPLDVNKIYFIKSYTGQVVNMFEGKGIEISMGYLDMLKTCQPQHLYFLSDDEIEEDDWYIHYNTHTKEYSLFKADSVFNKDNNPNIIDKRKNVYKYWNKKIIATTDTNLTFENKYIHDVSGISMEASHLKSLPQPSQSFIIKFIEAYNAGKPITEVLVEYDLLIAHDKYGNKIEELSLKVNPKDNTITIKKVKDSYSREEVIELFKTFERDTNVVKEYKLGNSLNLEEWIEQNLKH